MNIYDKILESNLYLSGEEFDITALSQRLGLSQRRARDACVHLCNSKRLVRRLHDGMATRYSRPMMNKWLCKPWTTYHPPHPTPEELTSSTALIYGRPV